MKHHVIGAVAYAEGVSHGRVAQLIREAENEPSLAHRTFKAITNISHTLSD